MKVLFYSKEYSTNFYFKDEITKLGYGCTIAESISGCIRSVQIEEPDLFLWDSKLIELYDFDIPKHVQVYGYDFDCYDINNTNDMSEFSKKYSEIYETTKSYKLLQDIKNLPADLSNEQVKFLKNHELQKHHVHLLKYFFSHPNQHITSKRLLSLLWNDDSKNHLATLYSYIHQIKKLAQKMCSTWTIKKTFKGCYQFQRIGADEETFL